MAEKHVPTEPQGDGGGDDQMTPGAKSAPPRRDADARESTPPARSAEAPEGTELPRGTDEHGGGADW